MKHTTTFISLKPKQHTKTFTLTSKQHDILILLYQYRFLNRHHIQTFLHHTSFNRIILWLNALTEQKYIKRYADPKHIIQAAVYSLGNKGRAYLLKHPDPHIQYTHLLDRVWREDKLSLQFRNHCMLVADISLSLRSLTRATQATLQFETKTDLDGRDHFVMPLPDILFSITEKNGDIRYYFLDIFDDLPVRMNLRRRIRQYVEYSDSDEWQDTTNSTFPNIIFVCPDERSKKYLYRRIQKTLEDTPDLVWYLTTWELIRTQGLRAEALQKVQEEEYSR